MSGTYDPGSIIFDKVVPVADAEGRRRHHLRAAAAAGAESRLVTHRIHSIQRDRREDRAAHEGRRQRRARRVGVPSRAAQDRPRRGERAVPRPRATRGSTRARATCSCSPSPRCSSPSRRCGACGARPATTRGATARPRSPRRGRRRREASRPRRARPRRAGRLRDGRRVLRRLLPGRRPHAAAGQLGRAVALAAPVQRGHRPRSQRAQHAHLRGAPPAARRRRGPGRRRGPEGRPRTPRAAAGLRPGPRRLGAVPEALRDPGARRLPRGRRPDRGLDRRRQPAQARRTRCSAPACSSACSTSPSTPRSARASARRSASPSTPPASAARTVYDDSVIVVTAHLPDGSQLQYRVPVKLCTAIRVQGCE